MSVVGLSPSDFWELLTQVLRLVQTYRHAGEELKHFEGLLGEWKGCLESLQRTLDLANKPTCRSFQEFWSTLNEGYKVLKQYEDLMKSSSSSSGSPQQTVKQLGKPAKKLGKSVSYRMDEKIIKDLICRAERHISTIHLYTSQVQL